LTFIFSRSGGTVANKYYFAARTVPLIHAHIHTFPVCDKKSEYQSEIVETLRAMRGGFDGASFCEQKETEDGVVHAILGFSKVERLCFGRA
jgi:hypothetical protein